MDNVLMINSKITIQFRGYYSKAFNICADWQILQVLTLQICWLKTRHDKMMAKKKSVYIFLHYGIWPLQDVW